MLPVTASRCHPRTVTARRVTGFWSRPLAGIDGPNVSWKRSDVAYPASAATLWQAELACSTSDL
jgi:hypothetical protein